MSDSSSRELARFAAGVAAFNGGRFWEAHEIWELLWSEEVGDRRLRIQALVQAAAGFHKAEIGVPNGARKLLTSSLRLLENEANDSWGIDVVKLRNVIRHALSTGSFLEPFPRIEAD